MSLRLLSRRRGHLANVAPPALLFLLVQTATCGGVPAEPGARLAADFPLQASSVLGAGRGFARVGAGFAPAPATLGVWEAGRVVLPGDGHDAFVFRGARGFEASVREVGAAGPGRIVERAVSYPREGGASFWTTTAGGAEEWIEVAAGLATADRPVASWRVTGATVRAKGGAVELAGADGVARVRVTAPVAYTASGRRVDARVRAAGASTIEVYADAGGEAALVDPMWITAASLNEARADHASAALGSGQVLASGGTDGVSTSLTTAEVYDPTADAWTNVGPMEDAHVCHTATSLTDGTVLVAGGADANGNIENVAEIYDATTTSWAYTDQQQMQWARMNHTATPIDNGRVLVVGGLGYYAFGADFKHPRTVVRSPSLTGPLVLPGAAGDQPEILPVGFNSICWNFPFSPCGGPGVLSSVEIYDPALQGWVQAAGLNQGHERHTATLLKNGQVLVTGGDNGFGVLGDTEIYNPGVGTGNDSWTSENQLITPREDHVAAILPNGDVLVAGGTDGNNPAITAAEIFHVGASAGTGGAGGAGTGGSGGSGTGGTGGSIATVSGVWMPANPLNTARVHATATVLEDGTVLVAGGSDGTQAVTSAEIYDPVAGTWAFTASMANARSEHTATPLSNGEVLVSGGVSGMPPSGVSVGQTAELYQPVLGNGAPCNAGSQCKSTFCVQGVCCGTVCSGATPVGSGVACEACATAMGATTDGTCGPINQGMVCASSPCMISGTCQAGTCSHTTPKTCTPVDACHEPGICDPANGDCPEGVARLDGSPCPGGVCIAGACVLDPNITPTTSASTSGGGSPATTTTSSSSGAVKAGAGGSGGGAVDTTGLLSGNGCAASPGGGGAGEGAAAGLLAVLFAALRRRRR